MILIHKLYSDSDGVISCDANSVRFFVLQRAILIATAALVATSLERVTSATSGSERFLMEPVDVRGADCFILSYQISDFASGIIQYALIWSEKNIICAKRVQFRVT